MAPRISVVVNTLNEETNLAFALGSVSNWADEIVVVDMYSDDRTREVASGFGARVFLHERTESIDGARGFAIAQATGDWVLLLDADEIVPETLSKDLRDIAGADRADAVRIPWLNFLLGSPLLHTGWGPHQDRHIRFFKPQFMHATSTIHNFLIPASGARMVEIPYSPGRAVVHFNYVDTSHFIQKLNRYTTVEAAQAFERGERASHWGTVARSAREFLGRYVKRRGYKDGWRGFYLSLLMALYRVVADAKLKELEMLGSSEAIKDSYREQARRLVDAYSDPRHPRGWVGTSRGDPHEVRF